MSRRRSPSDLHAIDRLLIGDSADRLCLSRVSVQCSNSYYLFRSIGTTENIITNLEKRFRDERCNTEKYSPALRFIPYRIACTTDRSFDVVRKFAAF